MSLLNLLGFNAKNSAEIVNVTTHDDYLNRLMLLALSVFEWKNLPDGIPARFIEKLLLYRGSCAFYNGELKSGESSVQMFVVSDYSGQESFNIYDEPTGITPISSRGLIVPAPIMDSDKFVIIRNNLLSLPTVHTLNIFAQKLAARERGIDNNIYMQKFPFVVRCTDGRRKTYLDIFRKIGDNEVVILGEKDLDINNDLSVLNLNVPFIADRLQDDKMKVWGEAMSYLGLNNNSSSKGERLIVDEVNANNQQIETSAQSFLQARKEAAEEINEKFGLNVSVDFRISATKGTKTENFEETGDEVNESIHNNDKETDRE